MKFLTLCAMFIAIGFGSAVAAENRLPDEIVKAMASPKKVTLLSLEREIARPVGAPKPKPDESHHGFKVLGSTDLEESASRTAAFEAVTNVVAAFAGDIARCFVPRHSLGFITDKDVTYDLVVCFHCDQLRIFRGEESMGTVGLTGSSKALDELLAQAKIPLSKAPQ